MISFANIQDIQHSIYCWIQRQFKQFLNSKPFNFNFHFYLQQDLKYYNTKAEEAVPLVKTLNKKDKRIGKARKMGREGEKKMVCGKYTEGMFDVRNTHKEILRINHASF